MARPRHRIPPYLALIALLPPQAWAVLALVFVGAIGLDYFGYLPDPVSGVVRQVERDLLGTEIGRPRAPPVGGGAAVDLQQARTLLDRLRVEAPHRAGYVREDWPHWLRYDGTCLNTREEVLRRQSLKPVRLSANGCDIVSGFWRDPYTGEEFTDPKRMDVDHMVPLEEAYASGGYRWNRDRRAAYANDVDGPHTLIAVSAAANRAKGDKGPEDWLPPQVSYRCQYVADWIGVKAHWQLSMDERERVTVGNILNACLAQASATTPAK